MAGIEKVCEAVEGCYPGPDMYRFKRNHIQCCPEHRKLFVGQPHVLVIFEPEMHYQTTTGMGGYRFKHDQIDGVYHLNEPGRAKLQIDTGFGEDLTPVRKVYEHDFCLYVPGVPGRVNGAYHNSTWSLGSTKRLLRRMLKRRLVIVKMPYTLDHFYSAPINDASRACALQEAFLIGQDRAR